MSETAVTRKGPRGMPEVARRQQIADAAAQVFSTRGYWATTMDEVSRQAGMSKKTVYQLFSSKAEIFDLLLRNFTQPFGIPFETEGPSQREILREGLLRVARSALDEAHVEISRVLIAEAARPGDVADAIERQGLCRGPSPLQQWLATQPRLGNHKVDDPERMAGVLFWSVVGDALIGMLLRIRPSPTEAELAARVEHVLGLYFGGSL